MRPQLPGGRGRSARRSRGLRLRLLALSELLLQVAVVGSGPAGFYAADALLKSESPTVEVDLIDRLPTPWGLVRLGVAPDHENIKAVSRAFEKTAARPGFRFFGNVEVGRDVTHEELLRCYDAVVYAVGAQTDRRLGIPGEDLAGSWPATAFVAWYNGHPDFQELEFDLSHERAVVIGNGNVAIDCVRMLALTAEELAPTDTTQAAVDGIVGSGLREIVMVGRRGPVQAAFTPPELKELGELAGADVTIDPADLELDPASERELEADRVRAQRNFDLLREYAVRAPDGKPRRIVLRFLTSPVALLGDEHVEAIEVGQNELVEENGRIVARPTGETERIDCGIVLRSVGYKGIPLPGVPFDEGLGTIPNDRGRVVGAERTYAAGWIKRGPSGVIGTNKKDATETVELLLEDARAGALHRPEAAGSLEALLDERGVDYVEYAGWQAIDAAERAAGEPLGRPRVKLARWEHLLAEGRPAARPGGAS
jgi:ferredoxin--NADP+ reductase